MIELGSYTVKELATLLNLRYNQDIENKLGRYTEYRKDGRGSDATYTITAKKNSFREYCVLDLKMPPNRDYDKYALFIYFYFNNEDFTWRPREMMEEFLRDITFGPSSKTIGKFIRELEDRKIIFDSEAVYYRVYKDRGVQKHDIIDHDLYCKGWREYFRLTKEEGMDSKDAMCFVRGIVGGTPRKSFKTTTGLFCEEADNLSKYASERLSEMIEASGKEAEEFFGKCSF